MNEIKKEAQVHMQKSIENFTAGLSKLRTGRAHPSLLESIMVSYYGTDTPLSQVANINVEGAQTLAVTPWEKNLVNDVDKAIRNSDLGLNPVVAGTIIRVPLPPLTEERRRDLTKVVKEEGEKTKVAIRNIRRDANTSLKNLLKDKAITEDELRSGEAEMQKITDASIKEIDELVKNKEKELMEI